MEKVYSSLVAQFFPNEIFWLCGQHQNGRRYRWPKGPKNMNGLTYFFPLRPLKALLHMHISAYSILIISKHEHIFQAHFLYFSIKVVDFLTENPF